MHGKSGLCNLSETDSCHINGLGIALIKYSVDFQGNLSATGMSTGKQADQVERKALLMVNPDIPR